MKKIIYSLTVLLAATLFSCDDQLDLEPVGDLVGSTSFPSNDGEAVALTNAIYQPNVGISTSLGYHIDLTTELEASGENPNSGGALLGVFQWEPNNTYITGAWTAFYTGIASANAVIDLVGASPKVSTELRSRLVGEAKFLRAYYYFYAVQFWGEVPLVLHSSAAESTNTTRAAIDDVYEQIVKDLKESAAALPSVKEQAAADKGRATKGAANAYLSKVYLVWGQTSDAAQAKARYTESVKYADEVIKSGDYELEEDFIQNWSRSNRNGKESIFATQHVVGQATNGGNHLAHCAWYNEFSNEKLPHVYSTDDRFYYEFNPDDQRRDYTYAKHLYNPKTNSVFTFDNARFRKYIDTTDIFNINSTIDINRTIIRYAEVYLLKAEAINERDGAPNADAFAALNTVRHRAFIKTANPEDYYVTSATAGNYAAFKKAIQDERTYELTYEQNRRLDLVRWKIYVQTVKNSGVDNDKYKKQSIEAKHYRFPIPKSQRDINPDGLWQNYGYDGSTIKDNPYRNFEPGYTDK